MTNFKETLNEYFNAQTINGTKPHLIYDHNRNKYFVSWFYSDDFLRNKFKQWEIIL